jgi:phosphoglycerate dehydrogenase-like enzyme
MHTYFKEKQITAPLPIITRFAGEKSLYGAQMSEWVFCQLISFERKVPSYVVDQTNRVWQPRPVFESLAGKKLGILGLGYVVCYVDLLLLKVFIF